MLRYWRHEGGNFTSLPQHFKESGYSVHGMGKIFHPQSSSGGTATDYVNPGPEFPEVLGDDYPYSWTIGDPELPDYYHAPNMLYWMCSAPAGYNTSSTTPCPAGGMHQRITPSFASVNASLEAEVPLMDAQIADQAIATLAVLRDRTARAAAAGASARPWLVAVGFHLPHLPDLVPQRFVDQYPDPVLLPDDQSAPRGMPSVAWSTSAEMEQYSDVRALAWHGAINTTTPPDFTRRLRRHYYGAVSFIDEQVGRVLAALQSNGQQQRTLIALFGDHGYHLGEHGIFCKVTNFQDATHTALIISTPTSRMPSTKSSSMVEFVDIFPTLADLAVNSRTVQSADQEIDSLASRVAGDHRPAALPAQLVARRALHGGHVAAPHLRGQQRAGEARGLLAGRPP